MDVKDILALINAGYTKEEISKMSVTTPEAVETMAEPKAEDIKAEPQIEAPAKKKEQNPLDSIPAIIESKIKEALSPFDDLYGKYATLVGMPQMGSVEPLGADDIINKFFEGE